MGGRVMSDHILEKIIGRAKALQARPEHRFADFEVLCRMLSGEDTARLIAVMAECAATISRPEGLTEAFVYLWREGGLNIQVKMIKPEAPTSELNANELDLVLMNLSQHTVEVPVYRTGIDPSELTRRPNSLVAEEALQLRSHEPVLVEAYREILDFKAVSGAATLLIFHSPARGPLTWVFDRKSGAPKHLTSTNLQDSRLQLAALLLGAMGSKQDIPALERIVLSEKPAFVRWEAAQALYRLDAEAGQACLRDSLSHDADRALAKAASATLSRLG